MKFITMDDKFSNKLFFVAAQEEIRNGKDSIANICRKQLHEIYGDNEKALNTLEDELQTIQEPDIFRYFVLKDIADVSYEYGYPVQLCSNISMIAYLLGLSYNNPLPSHYHCENCKYFETSDAVKFGFDLPDKICPSCGEKLSKNGFYSDLISVQKTNYEMRIASFVRNSLAHNLNEKHKHEVAGIDTYLRIKLHDSVLCQEIGDLRRERHINAGNPSFNKDIYNRVIQNIANDIISDPHRDNKQKEFAKELLSLRIDSFYILLRTYAYLFNTTEAEKFVEKITDFQYCILQDEVYDMLMQNGLPPEYAVRFCRGLMSEKLKAEYFELKARYNLQNDEALQDFEQTIHYFTSFAGVNFLYLACEKEMLSI